MPVKVNQEIEVVKNDEEDEETIPLQTEQSNENDNSNAVQ
jgi:hypothetical protein